MAASQSTDETPQYLPAVVSVPGTVANSMKKIKIALIGTPGQTCNQVQRVSYMGPLQADLAIYRLWVKSRPDLPTSTLPGFFVLEDGLFHA